MSGFVNDAKSAPFQEISEVGYGQSYPGQNPGGREPAENPLGVPLTIREVAQLIGCSDWTVRHRWLPLGLPHLRSGPSGKLHFYRNQVVRWLLTQQQKGGTY